MIDRGLVAMVAALLVALGAGPAVAGVPDPCAGFDGHRGNWLVAGHDPAHTTSRCVGSTRTPLCVVDTYLAGKVREVAALGRRAAPDSMVEMIQAEKQYGDVVYTYRVAGCRALTAADSPIGDWGPVWPALKKDRDHVWYPGDIRLDIHSGWCRRDLRGCGAERKDPFVETFIARKLDDRHWRLVDWEMGDVFPLQGHVTEPCRPEDEGWRALTGVPATSTSQCLGTDGTPLCDEETMLAEIIQSQRAYSNRPLFFQYKVIDCERLEAHDPIPGQWDPRPIQYPPLLNLKKLVLNWGPGDVRLGIRMRICNSADDTCKPWIESLTISRNEKGHWGGISSVEQSVAGETE
jgi:hypothetical protein